ncbi:uncharacterized protein [Gossypium hirsutum]|uniref:Uncharacterized protein isoform X3 n=1 Tax=Gossypium hirsutum TaxID=3635 RepID=A0ABM2ZEF0_GOSHI|nr:uncharacterized protein LOC107894494 isoform X3 [Gossypium hirsutum]
MGASTDSALDLDEQISQLMQCKPLSKQQLISKELGVFVRELLCVCCKTFLRFTCIILFSGQSIMRQGKGNINGRKQCSGLDWFELSRSNG